LAVDEIVAQVEEWDCRHVILTGGEPMLFAELIPLCARLRAIGRHITIETAGTLYLPVECQLMSISPKLSSSAPSAVNHPRWNRRHERDRHRPEVVARLMAEYDYQLKFVVESADDLQEIEAYLVNFQQVDPERVLLMPQGTDGHALAKRTEWLRPYCQERDYVFCPRKQIEWFGTVRGT
jgi:7-carboxy-7-deazaguanine synthase